MTQVCAKALVTTIKFKLTGPNTGRLIPEPENTKLALFDLCFLRLSCFPSFLLTLDGIAACGFAF